MAPRKGGFPGWPRVYHGPAAGSSGGGARPCNVPNSPNPILDPTVTDSEFSSFDDALRKLELEEDDLKRLISAGEIRAFREGSKMRLRVEDVERVAGELGIGGAVSESDAGELLEVEDLSLDGDDDAGMVTTQLSEEDTLLDDDLEEVEVDDEDDGDDAAPARRGGAAVAARGGRTRRGAGDADEEQKESTGILAAAVLTTLLMIFAIPFAIGMISAQKTGMTESVVNAVYSGE